MKIKNIVISTGLFVLLCALLPFSTKAQAQDFYGEGNVLIAVDMGPYKENEDVVSLDGTMGTLEWGADAPTGTSTRPAFDNRKYNVPTEMTVEKAPDYEAKVEYKVGQKVFLPFPRWDDPDLINSNDSRFDTDNTGFTREQLPQEIFDGDERRFLIHEDNIMVEKNGEEVYLFNYEETEDGSIHPCCDFLEIECVAVSDHCTYWQYTGKAYSVRTGFDIDDYLEAVELTDSNIAFFIETCETAYEREGEIFGDPLWEDMKGDCDRKAAYVVMDLTVVYPSGAGFFYKSVTDYIGFDCLFMNAVPLPGYKGKNTTDSEVDFFKGGLVHELNHYIFDGCMNTFKPEYSNWMTEALADYSADLVYPVSEYYKERMGYISGYSSRLRMIPGFLWNNDLSNIYPNYGLMVYTLGGYFLSFIEHETTGYNDGRFWMEFFASQNIGDVSATGNKVDVYLKQKTGENLDAWYVRFITALLTGEDDWCGLMGDELFKKMYRVDPYMFFRPYTDYGKDIGEGLDSGAIDPVISKMIRKRYMLTAVQGGGTAYAFRNDEGGRIAVTGADDRWYFVAANIDLPGEREVVEISSAEELAKIGRNPEYMLSGRYKLTADIKLGGKKNPWIPIGEANSPFIGEFDGNGHVISGLYINTAYDYQGLFGVISGNAVVKDLTVKGSVNGDTAVGGITGHNYGGTIKNCLSRVSVSGKRHVGGIVGCHEYGTVSDCIYTGNVSGKVFAGGISGCLDNGAVVKNCTSKGKVSGDIFTGNIVGLLANGSVANPDGSSEDGLELIYEDGKPMITISSRSADGKIKSIKTVSSENLDKSVTVEYRLKAGENGILRIRKIDALIGDIVIPDIIRTADGTEYRVTTTAGKAFRDLKSENVVLPTSIKTVNAGTFKGARIKTITLTAKKASDLKIKKGAFDEIKKPGSTTVFIRTSSKKQFSKIVEKCRKAGGTKLKYVYEKM